MRGGPEIAILLILWGAATARAEEGGTDLDLAGVDLPGYPHFQFVRSFAPDSPVSIAVDPTRYPAIAGSSCDAYVVADRDAAGWERDRTLVDVTSDGRSSCVFGGGSILANRVLVAGAGELSSDAGSGLGVPYDIVLDCNRNAVLDRGDFIDGRAEAGLYAVHDTVKAGPLRTTAALYGAGSFSQVAYYPVGISSMGQLPLVVVSHGWTHNYLWYDHIGRHLASYGYIVMSHVNDVGNGGPAATETASSATLANIDYLLSHQGALALGGHIDAHRITLIGHSTGGEGVVRAYTRLRNGDYVAQQFGSADIVLLVPLAPVAWLGPQLVDPFDVPFHMFAGAADADVSNAPLNNYVQLLAIYERARGERHLTYIHGAGHADFHNGTQPSGDWASGPDLIGRARTHAILKGYLLPLLELHVRGNPAARDYFTRMDDSFRPKGIAPVVVLAGEHEDAAAAGNFVLDDFETRPEIGISSSGGGVTFGVAHVAEVPMHDVDGSFDWTGAQPANGMTRMRPGDDEHCVVFDWSPGTPAHYELEIIPTQRDLSDDGYLSFRAAQGTRHPETVALAGPLDLAVTLRDGKGTASSIRIGNYGTVTRPYQRSGFGSGAGWANEFSTVRIRLTDFLTDGSGLDLTDVVALRFDFGPGFGSERGRLALDDVELADPAPPASFVLRLGKQGVAATLHWPTALRALAFHVYRGTVPSGGLAARGQGYAVYDHTCFEAADALGDGPFTSTDAEPVPADRIAYYYLVSIVTPAGEGSLGEASVDLDPSTPGEQLQRPNGAPCP